MRQDSTRFNLDDLRRGIEKNDAAFLSALYADDAVLRIIDRNHPPSSPQELRGRSAIASFYEDICGRAMTHRVEDALMSSDRASFTEACQYPDGTKVFCAAMMRLEDGKIIRQTNVQAWDE